MVSDSSAGKYSKYVYGNGLIASYETENATYKTMSGQGAKAILKGETTEYRTYLYDLRGSVVKATNESGKTVAEYSYSTYGKRETVSGDQYSPLGYCARDGVLTDLNGLIYMRARYYSTELMRFINQDIVVGDISNSNSLNRYTYVEGNPVTLIDPFGLEPKGTIGKAVKDIYNKAKKSVDDYFNAERLRKIAEILQIVSDGMEIASAVLEEVAKYAGIAGGAAGTATLAAMAASAIVLVIPGVGQVVEVGEFTIGIAVTEYCFEISAVSATAAGALQLGGSGLSKASNALYEKAASKETVTTNKGNEIDITPSNNHTSTDKNPGLKGEPNSSVDITDPDGNVKTRRWFDSEGYQFRDVDMTNHGNPEKHPEWPHEHGPRLPR